MREYLFGTSPLGPSRKVKASIRKATGKINSGTREARERLERVLLSKYGTGPESVLFANSLNELVFALTRHLKPANVLIVGPALDIYRDAALDSGAAVETVMGDESSHFLPDPHTLLEKARGADLVFLANPNRITGKAFPDAVLSDMIDALSGKDRVVAIDESFIEFSEGEGFIRKAAGNSRVVVMRSTACYYGLAGIELAWAVSSPELINILKTTNRWGLNLLALEAGRTALTDKTFRKLSAQSMAGEKRLLRRAAGRISGITMYDSDTHVLLMHMPDHAAGVVRMAENLGLAVEACRKTEGLDSSFLRVSVMKHEHNLKFIRLLDRACNENRGTRHGDE